jgi:hypothetical protein
MPEFPRRECRSCGAPVSFLALACPNCHAPNQPNPITTVAALLAVMLVGGAIALGVRVLNQQALHHKDTRQSASAATDASPPADANPGDAADYGWIVRAMAECDAEAKQKLDTLHFLVVPVAPTGLSLPGWSPSPIGDVGNSAKLLTSTDALIGLRNRVLVLYQKPLAFVVSDPATKTVYKWKPAVGVAALNARELSFDNLTLGFEMPDVADDIQWGHTVGIKKGTCYWINPLVLARSRSG